VPEKERGRETGCDNTSERKNNNGGVLKRKRGEKGLLCHTFLHVGKKGTRMCDDDIFRAIERKKERISSNPCFSGAGNG